MIESCPPTLPPHRRRARATERRRTAREHGELAAWRHGDRRAARRLFTRYHHELLGYFRRRAPDRAEDLTQATLLACIEARDRIRNESAFRHYVYGVAWRTLVRSGRHADQLTATEPDTLLSTQPDPEHLYEAKVRFVGVHAALTELSAANRETLELYYLGELRSREVAERLNIPHATVRSRLVRILAQLRSVMDAT